MQPETDWHQYMIEFTTPAAAGHTAAHHLAPALNRAQDVGVRTTWWHLRKAPAWRLRFQPEDPATTVVAALLATLAADGHIASFTRGIYEPETLAFGGPAAMDIAHTLFHHDSWHLLAPVAAQRDEPAEALGRRETTVVLFSILLRAASLDWFEIGDVWAKVADLRPAAHAHDLAPERSQKLTWATRRLMTVAPRSVPDLLPEPWVATFESAGQALAALARSGQLERGLRAVLAHHFIFHANRAGLPAADQATLAALAMDTVFHTTPERPDSSGPPTRHH
ncbi:thiopeptide-type bacteriocin biosynthesis protein [Streptomyces sp. SBT349]|uniref:thiopeptide-type bacteriocin biosynthesis protein n=1 Tax=Streptomyces sp. SBT349 TaxID=1580539 RepID=UPI00066EE71B|nr:thiopeptide-type bacteriocin biosynthesis protein [Streptomyces sp. SBT349]